MNLIPWKKKGAEVFREGEGSSRLGRFRSQRNRLFAIRAGRPQSPAAKRIPTSVT
jgi:hypothetical protein